MPDPAIAVLPYGKALGPQLAEVPVTELIWPLGCPDRLNGEVVGDLQSTDHLIVFPKTTTHFALRRGTKARISLILGEPAVIHAKHLTLLRLTYRRFWRILSFDETLLGRIPNGIFFPLGTTWVPEWRDLPFDKTGMCSLIASAKRNSTGHKLRHRIVDWVRDTSQDVEVMGRGYTAFERKSDGLAPYRYSVVIENIQEPNYFSEKLLDAVFCSTVPIYWGCPNLERFFDPTGIIQCRSENDIKRAIGTMSDQDFNARLPQLQALQPKLTKFCNVEKRAAEAIRASL